MTVESLPILGSFNEGGSEFGLSRYINQSECSRRAAIDAQLREAGDAPPPASQYGGAAIGTIGHKLMEFHRLRSLTPDQDPAAAIEYSTVVDERARCEAERVFRAYRDEHPEPDNLGRVEEVEVGLGPSSEISEAVGIDPYTCRIDLVTRAKAADIKRMKDSFEVDGDIDMLTPGYWIVDYKFLSRRDANLQDKTLGSMQYIAYPLAWNAAHPTRKVRGCIQLSLFRLKVPVFRLTVVAFPDATKQAVLHSFFLNLSQKLGNENKDGTCNPTACYQWGGLCRHLVSGRCERY